MRLSGGSLALYAPCPLFFSTVVESREAWQRAQDSDINLTRIYSLRLSVVAYGGFMGSDGVSITRHFRDKTSVTAPSNISHNSKLGNWYI